MSGHGSQEGAGQQDSGAAAASVHTAGGQDQTIAEPGKFNIGGSYNRGEGGGAVIIGGGQL